MAARVALVTDSTANLPAEVLRRFNIEVVPLAVVVDQLTYAEGESISAADIIAAQQAKQRVATSRPGPGRFVGCYDKCALAGYDEIISIHLSGELSGTCDAARLAAWDTAIPVTVLDTGLMSWGLGHSVLAAANARTAGASVDQIVHAARAKAAATRIYLYVDSLEYLWRGGRIGVSNAIMGTALNIKPILGMFEGRVQPVDKLRSAPRALARLCELTAASIAGAMTGNPLVTIDVVHCAAPNRARLVAEKMRHLVPACAHLQVHEASAVLSAHTGPGTVGIVMSPTVVG